MGKIESFTDHMLWPPAKATGLVFWLAAVFFMAAPAATAASAAVAGYAWSDNAGWLQFSCPILIEGVHLVNNKFIGYAWSDNIGWVSFDGANYAVTVDAATNELKGFAWSPNIGWLAFERAAAGDPPAAPFQSGSGPIATYNPVNGEINGWARALKNGDGWDGWLKLKDPSYGISVRGASVVGSAWGSIVVGWLTFNPAVTQCVSPYKTEYESASRQFSGHAWSDSVGWLALSPVGPFPTGTSVAAAPMTLTPADRVSGFARLTVPPDSGWVGMGGAWPNGARLDRATCQFEGYAWGDAPFSWVSMNCNNGGAGSCAQSEYKVRLAFPGCNLAPYPPGQLRFSADPSVFCTDPGRFIFYWIFDDPDSVNGDSQGAYQIQIDNNNDFSSPEFDTGKVVSANASPSVNIPDGRLAWNTDNAWRVKVWDSTDRESDWAVAATLIHTPKHALPKPAFDWLPKKIDPGQSVQFTNQSAISAQSQGLTYAWTFTGGGPQPASSTEAAPKVKFLTPASPISARLKLADDAGECVAGKDLLTGKALPKYREVNPTNL